MGYGPWALKVSACADDYIVIARLYSLAAVGGIKQDHRAATPYTHQRINASAHPRIFASTLLSFFAKYRRHCNRDDDHDDASHFH